MKFLTVVSFTYLLVMSVNASASLCGNHEFYKNEFAKIDEDRHLTQKLATSSLIQQISALRKFVATSINKICLPTEAEAKDRLDAELNDLAEAAEEAKPSESKAVIDAKKIQVTAAAVKLSALVHRPNRALELKPVFAILAEIAAGSKAVTVECITQRDDGSPIDSGYFSTKLAVKCQIEKVTPISSGKSCSDFKDRHQDITLILTPSAEGSGTTIQSISYLDVISRPECGPGA